MNDEARRRELAERLGAVRSRIERAAREAGRDDEPRLIVVTKFFPAADVGHLAALGVTDVGENRDQEAAAKALECDGLGLDWHFIGQLQSNKAKSVVRYAHAVHSVDRTGLVDALSRAMAREAGRRAEAGLGARGDLTALVQVDLRDADDAGAREGSPGPGRGGALPSEVPALADAIAAADGLRLGGLMAVAPLGGDPRPAFERLRVLAAELTAVHPGADMVSAGMSQDLEHAVAAGATHLRVGSDVLGPRPPVR
ncbi:YggS family pyridoxal phosphate enzyme [Zafaria sp. Z1313]|uniref:YggS family pyridoxal phosphate enzyme n=1 Tax=unclassified Zafaria TaxID=2828765 RepID=UPI002E768408|nr:YggS family pyridoxal phosphate enzyme [Zafaria sp. J156]MEE1620283.1 YggS family pyridoxal phosphate enzyme [Zafaria sp. J156]